MCSGAIAWLQLGLPWSKHKGSEQYLPTRDINLFILEGTFMYAYFSVMFLMGSVV